MDHPGLEPGGVDGLHHPLELLQLGGRAPLSARCGVHLGIDAGDGHVGKVAVHGQDLVRLPGEKPSVAHAGVHLNVGLHHGGAGLRQAVERHAGVIGADGTYGVQVDELLQLLPVRRGAEHQDLLVHKASLPQGGGIRGLGHGKAPDPLLPQELCHFEQAGPVGVSGEDGVNGGGARLLLDYGGIAPDGFSL